jgi:hypothetical protein
MNDFLKIDSQPWFRHRFPPRSPACPEFVNALLNEQSLSNKAAGFQAEFADRVKPDFPA